MVVYAVMHYELYSYNETVRLFKDRKDAEKHIIDYYDSNNIPMPDDYCFTYKEVGIDGGMYIKTMVVF